MTEPRNITKGAAFAQFHAPAAPWLVEANEKMADAYLRHEDKLGGA